jgi:hypothetical protein
MNSKHFVGSSKKKDLVFESTYIEQEFRGNIKDGIKKFKPH